MLGTTTVRTTTTTRSVSAPRGFLDRADCRESWTVSEHARALLSPDEVRRLEADTCLLLMPGADPVRAARLDYRRDREFVGLFDENPMEEQGVRDRGAAIANWSRWTCRTT
jgi:type IV secretory pathway TraG/TraD family ATPase VirD4